MSANFIGRQKIGDFCMSHDRFYRPIPILSAINLAVELGSNFAEKIGRENRAIKSGYKISRFYHLSVIGFIRTVQHMSKCVGRVSTNPPKQISSRFPGDFRKTFLPIFVVLADNYPAGSLTPEITVIPFTLQLNLPAVRNYVASS